jgi:hypothetical protein
VEDINQTTLKFTLNMLGLCTPIKEGKDYQVGFFKN